MDRENADRNGNNRVRTQTVRDAQWNRKALQTQT
jgi:hypothetical protein